jgi:hypothetical protein
MSQLLKELEEYHGTPGPSAERLFLEFKYPEIRDLLKHFLTLISATLVFSITFSEKVLTYSAATDSHRLLIGGAWLLLVVALGLCGLGVFTLYLAAERALSSLAHKRKERFQVFARASYVFQDLSGLLFGIALAVLVGSAIFR